MSHENIIRAWKDQDFRNNLRSKERALLPEHPAGLVQLTNTQLRNVAGGRYYNTGDGACSHTPNCI